MINLFVTTSMRIHYFIFILFIFGTPGIVAAEYRGSVSAWIPWFAAETGIASAETQLSAIDTIHPFAYEASPAGIIPKTNVSSSEWSGLFKQARARGVGVIPTISWFSGEEIHNTLSNRQSRRQHIRDIVELVSWYDFAGVDIDYERKQAETIDYFSIFLQELKHALGNKELVCSIEARTPPASRFRDVPDTLEYANDYQAINRHCDRVQLMAYDQQRIDWRLNTKRQGVPYVPVADTEWVEKVLELALEDIDEDKLILGIPTYGRAWDVTVAPDWYREYDAVASLNHPRILELAKKYDVPIGRSNSGEAVISYFPEDSIWSIFDALDTPAETSPGYEAAAKALAVANYADREIPVRFVSWSDASAVEEKLKLAEQYNLRGVALFKVDGEEDPDIWKLF